MFAVNLVRVSPSCPEVGRILRQVPSPLAAAFCGPQPAVGQTRPPEGERRLSAVVNLAWMHATGVVKACWIPTERVLMHKCSGHDRDDPSIVAFESDERRCFEDDGGPTCRTQGN